MTTPTQGTVGESRPISGPNITSWPDAPNYNRGPYHTCGAGS